MTSRPASLRSAKQQAKVLPRRAADNCVGGRFSDSFVAKTAAMQATIFLEIVGAARICGILIRLSLHHFFYIHIINETHLFY